MINFEHVSFTYPTGGAAALSDVSVQLPDGELILVMGPSGAGKSTFLRCINGLVPHFSGGTLSGQIRVRGMDPLQVAPQGMSRYVGFVFQDPESQFVMDRVEDEIAFALENAGLPPAEMRVRVEETLDLLDLTPLRDRTLITLSGGEKQRVAIASVLALRPSVLVLDEPTSQLDPKSAEDVLNALVRLNHDLGLTILLAEHRLERVLPYVDQILYLPTAGAQPCLGEPRDILADIDLTPPLVTLAKAFDWSPLPLTIKEGLRFSRKQTNGGPSDVGLAHMSDDVATTTDADGDSVDMLVDAREVTAGYNGTDVLRGATLQAHKGEIVVVMGRNGSGKTTLLKTLVGLVALRKGNIQVNGQSIRGRDTADICRDVAYLAQDPNTLLFADTVDEELKITLRNHGMKPRNGDIRELLDRLEIASYAHHYPRDLSVGERQRVALAAITITDPDVLLLDEPTRGLDYGSKRTLVRLLDQWRQKGMAIVVVTHDVELAAQLADRVVLLSQGEVIAEGDPATVLGSSPLFAPQIAKLFPQSGWLTVDDVLAAASAAEVTLPALSS